MNTDNCWDSIIGVTLSKLNLDMEYVSHVCMSVSIYAYRECTVLQIRSQRFVSSVNWNLNHIPHVLILIMNNLRSYLFDGYNKESRTETSHGCTSSMATEIWATAWQQRWQLWFLHDFSDGDKLNDNNKNKRSQGHQWSFPRKNIVGDRLQ